MTNRKSPRLQSYKKMMAFDKNWPSNLSSRAAPLTTQHANDKKLTTIWALSSPKPKRCRSTHMSDMRSKPIIHSSVIISEFHEEAEARWWRRRRRGRRSVFLALCNPLPVQLKLSSVVDRSHVPKMSSATDRDAHRGICHACQSYACLYTREVVKNKRKH